MNRARTRHTKHEAKIGDLVGAHVDSEFLYPSPVGRPGTFNALWTGDMFIVVNLCVDDQNIPMLYVVGAAPDGQSLVGYLYPSDVKKL